LNDVCIKDELDPEYWNKLSENSLREALNQQEIHKKAKNVVIFLGDGMGITTITSARILKGQLLNNSGEESSLSFDNFPYISLIKVIILNFMSIPIDIILQISCFYRLIMLIIKYLILRERRQHFYVESKQIKVHLE
jgi:hypothetical protein